MTLVSKKLRILVASLTLASLTSFAAVPALASAHEYDDCDNQCDDGGDDTNCVAQQKGLINVGAINVLCDVDVDVDVDVNILNWLL